MQAVEALQESEERFRILAESTFEGIAFHEDGIIVDANQQLATILGYEQKELIGIEIAKVIHPEDYEIATVGVAGPDGTDEHRAIRKDGSIIYVEVHGRPLEVEGRSMRVTAINEITKRKQAEDDLRSYANRLNILREIDQAILAAQSLEEISQIAVDHIRKLIPCYGAIVWFLDSARKGVIQLAINVEEAFLPWAPGELIPFEVFGESPDMMKDFSPGNTTIIDDLSKLEHTPATKMSLDHGMQSVLVATLATKDEPFGFLQLEATEIGAFNSEQAKIASEVASLMVIALQQARLFDSTQRQLEELKVLHQIASAGAEAASVDKLLGKTTDFLSKNLYKDAMAIGLLDEDGATIRFYSPKKTKKGYPYFESLPLGAGITSQVIESGEALIITDVRLEKSYLGEDPEIRSELCVPLKIGAKIIDVIDVESYQIAGFNETDERFLTTIADQLGTTIEKLQLFEAEHKARQIAETMQAANKALAQELDTDNVLETLLDYLSKLVPFDSAAVFFMETESIATKRALRGHEQRADIEELRRITFDAKTNPVLKKLLKTKKGMLIPDTENYPGWVDVPGVDYVRSWIGIPLVVGDEVIGQYSLDKAEPNFFTEEHLQTAEALAAQAAVALQNARLFEEAQRSARETTALVATGKGVSKTLDTIKVLEIIADEAKNLLEGDSGVIHLLEPDAKTLTCVVSRQENPDVDFAFKELKLSVGEGFTGRVAQNGIGELINGVVNEPGGVQVPGSSSEDHCLALAPLKQQDKVIGVLTVLRPDIGHPFVPSDLELLTAFANQATIAIQNALLYEQTSRRTEELETLTQVSNSLRASSNQEDMLFTLMERVELFGADTRAVLLIKDNQLIVADFRGPKVSKRIIQTHKPTNDYCWDVIRTGQSQFVTEIPVDSRYDEKMSSMAIFPLQTSEGVFGVGLLVWIEPNKFSDEERRLITAFADIVGNALGRARVLETLELQVADRTKQLTTLYEVTSIASAYRDLDTTLEQALKKILGAVSSNVGCIHLFEKKQSILNLMAIKGISQDITKQIEYLADEDSSFGRAIQIGDLLIVLDMQKDERMPEAFLSLESQVYIGVPIKIREQVIGVISVFWETPQGFTMDEINLLTIIADQLAIIVEGAQLREQAEEAILTGERQRLARDLHDAVTQSLYSLTLLADAAQKLSDDKKWARSEHYLRMVSSTAQQVLKEMRLLVYELRPAALEREGLVEALRQRLETVENRAGIETDLRSNIGEVC